MNEDDVLAPLVKFAISSSIINDVVKITPENVNQPFPWMKAGPDYINWLMLAVSWFQCTKDIVIKILSFNPNITYDTLKYCRYEFYELLLDYGIDVNIQNKDGVRFFDTLSTIDLPPSLYYNFVDYGVNFSNVEGHISKNLLDYVSLSNRRVFLCRKALLALLCVCNISSFRALREILLCVANQAWRLKGAGGGSAGEGCGPRAHKWAETVIFGKEYELKKLKE